MNNKLLPSVFFCLMSSAALTATAEAEKCLDWDVQNFPASSEQSSCAYFNQDKVSTRFVVRNSCDIKINGVFTYFKDDISKKSVMSVQSFSVDPGQTEEVANPCDMHNESAYQVSQVSY
ncbi:hypothetical protein AB4876_11710 [Zhongshania guokunii]|uniref:Uncharacterized protein n=1 Tax=Zhongshania guokunii TaxID=641783 RepID=A0ABV3U6I6_9GAMM